VAQAPVMAGKSCGVRRRSAGAHCAGRLPRVQWHRVRASAVTTRFQGPCATSGWTAGRRMSALQRGCPSPEGERDAIGNSPGFGGVCGCGRRLFWKPGARRPCRAGPSQCHCRDSEWSRARRSSADWIRADGRNPQLAASGRFVGGRRTWDHPRCRSVESSGSWMWESHSV